MGNTPKFGISCFNYEPSRIEAATAVSKILSSDRTNFGAIEKAVYKFLGIRKTAEERRNLEAIAGEKFSEEYFQRIEDSSKNMRFTKRLDKSQWILFFNEYPSFEREKADFQGEKVEVEYKSFFSIPAPKDLQKCMKNAYSLADCVGDFANAAEKITIMSDDRITFKIPRNPESAIFYRDNIVAYYQKPDASTLVESEFGSILESHGIRERNAMRQKGFDFKSEFDYSQLNGSHTQLVARAIANKLSVLPEKKYRAAELSALMLNQAYEFSYLSPKQMILELQKK
ncbi:MAG: hypothetical protein NTV63_01130 [Candidatus Woesearchaeota archaeon]|nr:hypothetical protein [Candidatus Woesearchaeota archaeon]